MYPFSILLTLYPLINLYIFFLSSLAALYTSKSSNDLYPILSHSILFTLSTIQLNQPNQLWALSRNLIFLNLVQQRFVADIQQTGSLFAVPAFVVKGLYDNFFLGVCYKIVRYFF